PQGADVDPAAAARGKQVFVSQHCIDCHEIDPQKHLPYMLVDLATLWPAYKPEVLGYRMPPFAPLANSPGQYDDKLVVVDASDRSARRGFSPALPRGSAPQAVLLARRFRSDHGSALRSTAGEPAASPVLRRGQRRPRGPDHLPEGARRPRRQAAAQVRRLGNPNDLA